MEDKLEEGQYGFRPQRGTTDAIFTLKMVMEKNWEWDQQVFIAFVNLEKHLIHYQGEKYGKL